MIGLRIGILMQNQNGYITKAPTVDPLHICYHSVLFAVHIPYTNTCATILKESTSWLTTVLIQNDLHSYTRRA